MSETLEDTMFASPIRAGRERSKLNIKIPDWQNSSTPDISQPTTENTIRTTELRSAVVENKRDFKVAPSREIRNSHIDNKRGTTTSITTQKRVKKFASYTPRSLRIGQDQYNFLNMLCDEINYCRRNSPKDKTEDSVSDRITYNSLLRVTCDLLMEKFYEKKGVVNFDIANEEMLPDLIRELLA